MTAGQRDAALAAGGIAYMLSDWIDSNFICQKRLFQIVLVWIPKPLRRLCVRSGGWGYCL